MISAIKTVMLWCISITLLLLVAVPIALFIGFDKLPTDENK